LLANFLRFLLYGKDPKKGGSEVQGPGIKLLASFAIAQHGAVLRKGKRKPKAWRGRSGIVSDFSHIRETSKNLPDKKETLLSKMPQNISMHHFF
jgi:hypothetical protein